ncbi:hypothetical protein J6590_012273 [Homalodisca vitripennis]|nr:hypothetical protein J6590_012273 [Homalodisca vitripennis]
MVGSAFLGISGRHYIQFVHIQMNCVPTRILATRKSLHFGVRCRAGCHVLKIATHGVQCWHGSHGGRTRRNDAVFDTVAASLSQAAWNVVPENISILSSHRYLREICVVVLSWQMGRLRSFLCTLRSRSQMGDRVGKRLRRDCRPSKGWSMARGVTVGERDRYNNKTQRASLKATLCSFALRSKGEVNSQKYPSTHPPPLSTFQTDVSSPSENSFRICDISLGSELYCSRRRDAPLGPAAGRTTSVTTEPFKFIDPSHAPIYTPFNLLARPAASLPH